MGNIIFFTIGIILFALTWFLKLCLFKKSNDVYQYNGKWVYNFIRVKYPIWEVILVAIVTNIPIINILIFSFQLVWLIFNIKDGDYKFSIININGIPDDEETLNNFKEQWAKTHKIQYKLYKGIKNIFTFDLV